MEVILLQDINKLGKENELVNVRAGYARNFLIPRKLAIMATDSARRERNEWTRQQDRREDKLMKELNVVMEKLKNTRYQVGAKTGTSGKIFGSVTNIQLAQAIKKQSNVTVDRKKITLPEELSMLGEYKALIKLHKEAEVEVNFEVVAE